MMSNTKEQILAITDDPQLGALLDQVLRSAGYLVMLVQEGLVALDLAARPETSLVILDERLGGDAGSELAAEIARRHASLPVVFLSGQDSPETLRRVMRLGISDCIALPPQPGDLLGAVEHALALARRRQEAHISEVRRNTAAWQGLVDELEILARLGRQVAASLSLEDVQVAIVDAAVELTGAEEGTLLLIDDESGELYIRALRSFQEDSARTCRLPLADDLANNVLRSREDLLYEANEAARIKPSYPVQSLIFIPLQHQGAVFGILGVDNRHDRAPLTQRQVRLLHGLAGYAVTALDNARLYEQALRERSQLETILSGMSDGAIVVDPHERLVLVNPAARQVFHLTPGEEVKGLPFWQVFNQPEMLDLLSAPGESAANRTELNLDENHILSVQVALVPGIGKVFTLQDITGYKKLDRIKTEFVNTVSHDLRSPLTAILGYAELVARAGPVNDLQRDFIRRVQVGVQNITHLVDDLLDLGRIESGFDLRKDEVNLDQLIAGSVEGMKKQLADKGHRLRIAIAPDIPPFPANPVQMRQMIDNLLDNAIKYTAAGGEVAITGRLEQNQVILEVRDTGMGIPAADIPYIFEKFYRASNAGGDVTGTGLGLAIVKSIVETHGGRIWVNTHAGKGSAFTVVLPLVP